MEHTSKKARKFANWNSFYLKFDEIVVGSSGSLRGTVGTCELRNTDLRIGSVL